MRDSFRSKFYNHWMTESPELVGSDRNDLHGIITNLEMDKEYGDTVQLTSGEFPIFQFILKDSSITTFYCVDSNKIINNRHPIVAALQCQSNGSNVDVATTAKDSNYLKEPYVTNIYSLALDYANGKALKFRSDENVTEKGKKLWKRLVVQPDLVVSVYNTDNPGESLSEITDPEDIDKFAVANSSYRKWRFLLSRNKQEFVESVRSIFGIRRLEEISGIAYHSDLYS